MSAISSDVMCCRLLNLIHSISISLSSIPYRHHCAFYLTTQDFRLHHRLLYVCAAPSFVFFNKTLKLNEFHCRFTSLNFSHTAHTPHLTVIFIVYPIPFYSMESFSHFISPHLISPHCRAREGCEDVRWSLPRNAEHAQLPHF